MKTSGNTILITGGATGIGLALAEAFVKADNKVDGVLVRILEAIPLGTEHIRQFLLMHNIRWMSYRSYSMMPFRTKITKKHRSFATN